MPIEMMLLSAIIGVHAIIALVARIYGKDVVTQVAHPDVLVFRQTCEMSPAEMLDSHTHYGIDDVDIAQDELEATGSWFERAEVEALLALANDRQRLEAR